MTGDPVWEVDGRLRNVGDEAEVQKDPINTLQKYYVKINTEADEHPEYDDLGREWFAKLEQGDPEAQRLWKWFRKCPCNGL